MLRTLLLTDIHGCTRTFKALLHERLQLKKQDHLYLLGDYINKGPDSKGTLDELLRLQADGYHLTCLRGNHDQWLLDALAEKDLDKWQQETEKQLTLQSFSVKNPEDIPRKYFDFIAAMPYYLELDHHFLVHAGFNFQSEKLYGSDRTFDDTYAMMNSKEYWVDKAKLKGKTLVHGHKPLPLPQIKKAIHQKKNRIDLDAGCVFIKNTEDGLGNLVALHLETLELTVQENIEDKYEIAKKAV